MARARALAQCHFYGVGALDAGVKSVDPPEDLKLILDRFVELYALASSVHHCITDDFDFWKVEIYFPYSLIQIF